ncbi:cysteinyl-tRNA synthetase, partial [Tulasnella sp. 403]
IAVDIARLSKGDPMVAAQRLRDYAVSYGAKGSTMIMVIAVEDLFKPRDRQPTMDVDMDLQRMAPRRPEHLVGDRTLARLGREVPAPVGHIALVFTDIRNSTSLWEKNPGMPNAMKLHNSLLRRQLRVVGGYEVKTEGDAFMVSFPTVATALLWCFNVQVQLLQEEWPLWILESEEGKEVVDTDGNVLARGLSVRMGIHWGAPNCEPDHVTGRMDYLGTVVNRAARISGAAKGGQIMVSNDVVREIAALIPMDDSKPGILTSVDNVACYESNQTAEALQRMGVIVKEVGEARLKGLEVPEMLSLVYPRELVGRLKLLETEETPENASAAAAASRVQFSVEQIRSLAMLTIRIEALASNRVFRSTSTFSRNLSIQSNTGADAPIDEADHSVFMYANPELLLPTIKDNATDADLLYLMDSLSLRIENALASMYLQKVGGYHQVLAALEQATKVDAGMLVQALSMFGSLLEV